MVHRSKDHEHGGHKEYLTAILEELSSSSSSGPPAEFLVRLRDRVNSLSREPEQIRAILSETISIPTSLQFTIPETDDPLVTNLLTIAAEAPQREVPTNFLARLTQALLRERQQSEEQGEEGRSKNENSSDSPFSINQEETSVVYCRSAEPSNHLEEKQHSLTTEFDSAITPRDPDSLTSTPRADVLLHGLAELQPCAVPTVFLLGLAARVRECLEQPGPSDILMAEEVEIPPLLYLEKGYGTEAVDHVLTLAAHIDPPPAPAAFMDSLLNRVQGVESTLMEAEAALKPTPRPSKEVPRQVYEEALFSERDLSLKEEDAVFLRSDIRTSSRFEAPRMEAPGLAFEMESNSLAPTKAPFWRTPAFTWGLSIAATMFLVFTVIYNVQESTPVGSGNQEIAQNTMESVPSTEPNAVQYSQRNDPLPSDPRTVTGPTDHSSPPPSSEATGNRVPASGIPAGETRQDVSPTRGMDSDATAPPLEPGTGIAPVEKMDVDRAPLTTPTMYKKAVIPDSSLKRKNDSLRGKKPIVVPSTSAPKDQVPSPR